MIHISDLRLFIAINPPAEIRELLYTRQLIFHECGLRVKWVEKQNLHLTLLFLGDTGSEKLPGIIKVLNTAADNSPGFTLDIGEMGAFPNLKQPRVIWLGLREQIAELSLLQQNIRKGLQGTGTTFDTKPFRPHLTLGRVKDSRFGTLDQQFINDIRKTESANNPVWRIDSIELIRSDLTSSGPRYTVLESFYLRG